MVDSYDDLSAHLSQHDGLIIQSELDKFLLEKLQKRKRRFFISILFVLFILLLVYGYTRLPDVYRYYHRFSLSNKKEVVRQLLLPNMRELKHKTLVSFPKPTAFSNYESNGKPIKPNLIPALLVHRYANDFYGKAYGLDRSDENLLVSYIAVNGLNPQDYCFINVPFIEQNFATKRKFIHDGLTNEAKLKSIQNPRIAELENDIVFYQSQLKRRLSGQISDSLSTSFTEHLMFTHIDVKDSIGVRIEFINFLKQNPSFLADVIFYQRRILELEQELNIRLGIAYLAMGKAFRIKGNQKLFGWLEAGLKGANFLSNNKAPKKYEDFLSNIKIKWIRYEDQLKRTRILFEQSELDAWHLSISNPLKVALKVKDVGLFGANRKTNEGIPYEHHGIDLIAEKGTPVHPISDGYIIYVGNKGTGHGNHIEIWHNEHLTSRYSHLDSDFRYKKTLQRFNNEGPFFVSEKDIISSVGMSGNIPDGDPQYGYSHLHLEIKEHLRFRNPFQLFNESINVIHE